MTRNNNLVGLNGAFVQWLYIRGIVLSFRYALFSTYEVLHIFMQIPFMKSVLKAV